MHTSRNKPMGIAFWAGCFIATLWLAGATAQAQATADPETEASRNPVVRGKPLPVKAQRVTFETAEKVPVQLVATYVPAETTARNRRAPIVLLLHMYGEDRSKFDPLVPVLHDAGFAVLALDLRGHGESVEPASLKLKEKMEDRDPRLFRDMGKDVEAAYRWLARRADVDPGRFALVGASVGASVALEYAVRDKSVDALVLMTPGLDYLGLDSRPSARKFSDRPVLVLTAEEEKTAADDLARDMAGAKVKIVGPRPTGEHSMALHGTRMLGKAAGVEKTIASFLVEAVGKPSESPVVASMVGEVYYEPGSNAADRLSLENLRTFSSAAEAEARGYRAPKRRAKD